MLTWPIQSGHGRSSELFQGLAPAKVSAGVGEGCLRSGQGNSGTGSGGGESSARGLGRAWRLVSCLPPGGSRTELGLGIACVLNFIPRLPQPERCQ